jgi:hypothetical protein
MFVRSLLACTRIVGVADAVMQQRPYTGRGRADQISASERESVRALEALVAQLAQTRAWIIVYSVPDANSVCIDTAATSAEPLEQLLMRLQRAMHSTNDARHVALRYVNAACADAPLIETSQL